MQSKNHQSATIDVGSSLEGIINNSNLPKRVETNFSHVIDDFETKCDEIGVDIDIDDITTRTQQLFEQYVSSDETSDGRFTTDYRVHSTLAACLLIASRENNIPLSSDDITQLTRDHTAVKRVIEQNEIVDVEKFGEQPYNIILTTPDKEYMFLAARSDDSDNDAYDTLRSKIDGGEPTELVGLVDECVTNAPAEKSLINNTRMEIDNLNGSFTQSPDPSVFVDRLVEVFDETPTTEDKALDILNQLDGSGSGRKPALTGGAALWLAIKNTDYNTKQTEICKELHISEVGLRDRAKEIESKVEL